MKYVDIEGQRATVYDEDGSLPMALYFTPPPKPEKIQTRSLTVRP